MIGLDKTHLFLFIAAISSVAFFGAAFNFSEKTILWLIFASIVSLGLELINIQLQEFRKIRSILEQYLEKQ